jgi:hypothetical protein
MTLLYEISHDQGGVVADYYTSQINPSEISLQSPGFDSTPYLLRINAQNHPNISIRVFDPDYFFETNTIGISFFFDHTVSMATMNMMNILKAVDKSSQDMIIIELLYSILAGYRYLITILDDFNQPQSLPEIPLPAGPHKLDIQLLPVTNISGVAEIRVDDVLVETLGGLSIGQSPGLSLIQVGVIQVVAPPFASGDVQFDQFKIHYNRFGGDKAFDVAIGSGDLSYTVLKMIGGV